MSDEARNLARSLLARHSRAETGGTVAPAGPGKVPDGATRPSAATDVRRASRARAASFADHPEVVATQQRFGALDAFLDSAGLPNPFFQPHDGMNANTVAAYGGELINFGSYSYLGLSADPRVLEAAKSAIDTYGTSVSASRLVSGEIPLYGQMESRLARAYAVDDAIVTTSGYLTNAAVVGFLLGPDDVAVCDSLVHSSVVSGTQWAGCRRVNFRHNDPESLAAVLEMSRNNFTRALVILEGHYSMDGDLPPLPELIEVARRYDCVIMIDEAHSFGVLGDTGHGIREVYDLPGDAVDIWMGTLSKALGSCGGFLAGDRELIRAFKYSAPGLSLYTGGPAPSAIAAASAAFDVLEREPERVRRLQANGRKMSELFIANGFDLGIAQGTPILPVILGGDARAAMASVALIESGINVGAIMAPAVAAGQERLRFFVSSEHTTDQLEQTVETLKRVTQEV